MTERQYLTKKALKNIENYKRVVHSILVCEFGWDRILPNELDYDAIREDHFKSRKSPYKCADEIMRMKIELENEDFK